MAERFTSEQRERVRQMARDHEHTAYMMDRGADCSDAIDATALRALLSAADERERLREALADMANQFAYERDDGKLWTGGLSALELAFDTLGLPEPCTREEMALAARSIQEGEAR